MTNDLNMRKKAYNREELKLIIDDVLKTLSGNVDIKTVKGIGSYFGDKKTNPHDVDLLIELNKSFEQSDTKQLSDLIEAKKDKYQDEEGTLLNIFIRDSGGKVLNSVDLWFYHTKGEEFPFESRLSESKPYFKAWEKAPVLGMRKKAQSTKEDIQKAQAGDQDAIVKVIEDNMGLIVDSLTKWRYVPRTPEFEDIVSDIKLKIIEDILPSYDISRGAFSTFLTTAIYNFLKNIPRGKAYKAEEKEVSLEEPVKDTKEDVTIQDTLADPNSFLVGLTLSGVRDSFKAWLHETKPELENIMLRIYDLKIDSYTHDQLAEILNKEKLLRKNKVMTKKIVTDYVNLYMKPFLKDYFSSIKTASLVFRVKDESKHGR